MRIAHIRSRIRRLYRTSCRWCRIFLIPAGLTYTLRPDDEISNIQVWAVFARHVVLFLRRVTHLRIRAESQPNPLLRIRSAERNDSHTGGNMEGKEVRFGIANSALFATVTTDASCGAVNSMHDSFMPLEGLVPLDQYIASDELVFGGAGGGMYGMP